MDAQEKDSIMLSNLRGNNDLSLGLYMHVPFCGSVCDFCAFYQEKPRRQDLERYLAGMAQEMKRYDLNRPIDTVFWGGGTPGLLPAKDLRVLGELTLTMNRGHKPKEWTVEMAPATVKLDKIEALLEMGVTRISMGVQTFNDELLANLGRLHSSKQVDKAYEILRAAGCDNINFDLIFAIPGQSEAMLLKDLQIAVDYAPEHISTYCLTFEEDTKLWLKLSRGEVKRSVPMEEHLYRKTWAYLQDAGYKQYEVSNFAKSSIENTQCVHNVHTWMMHEWVGIGPSASSQYRNKRYTNVASIDDWLKGLDANEMNLIDEEVLTSKSLAEDALIFGLRMNEGINLQELRVRFQAIDFDDVKRFFERLVSEQLLEIEDGYYRTTISGRLVLDQIALELMEFL